jgi:hypothetical protein
MQDAETVLGVIRERGRRGLPLERLYRQLFNRELFLVAYGRIYSNADFRAGFGDPCERQMYSNLS